MQVGFDLREDSLQGFKHGFPVLKGVGYRLLCNSWPKLRLLTILRDVSTCGVNADRERNEVLEFRDGVDTKYSN